MQDQRGINARTKFAERLQSVSQGWLVRNQQAGRPQIGQGPPLCHSQAQRDAIGGLCATLQQSHCRQGRDQMFGIDQQVGGQPLFAQERGGVDTERRHGFKIAGQRRNADDI